MSCCSDRRPPSALRGARSRSTSRRVSITVRRCAPVAASSSFARSTSGAEPHRRARSTASQVSARIRPAIGAPRAAPRSAKRARMLEPRRRAFEHLDRLVQKPGGRRGRLARERGREARCHRLRAPQFRERASSSSASYAPREPDRAQQREGARERHGSNAGFEIANASSARRRRGSPRALLRRGARRAAVHHVRGTPRRVPGLRRAGPRSRAGGRSEGESPCSTARPHPPRTARTSTASRAGRDAVDEVIGRPPCRSRLS